MNNKKPEPEPEEVPTYLSLKQIATILGVTDETVRKYRNTLGLPVRRIGGVLRADKKEFIEWCKKRPQV